ncbi:hypothetical protein Pa4123_89500 [Phytohabitans aurantiacus]|uniref:Uncharacterized protein n=1 Tax=Phytohabitans aurantiacus TaxID=3016789 RepID=A0ABQ5RAN9_9ACTN|nr:hypothetical protein Pa4123_89500 [Phytohabitans aurantiacus]
MTGPTPGPYRPPVPTPPPAGPAAPGPASPVSGAPGSGASPVPAPPPGYGAGAVSGSDGDGSGHPAVDAVIQSLANAANVPLRDQIAEYEAAHRTLQETLATIDQG